MVADLRVVTVEPGELVCRVGKPVTYWFGVIDGLLKMSNDSALGVPITFTGVPSGGWFGEGTVLKNEVYRYNIQALRRSTVAGIGTATFHWLLDRSIGFNRFVMNQLNERLGQFIGAREIDRLTHPDERVARSLAALFHPVLYPGVGELAAHHAAGAGLPGGLVAPARQRGAARAAGSRRDPRRIRRRARARPGAPAPLPAARLTRPPAAPACGGGAARAPAPGRCRGLVWSGHA